MELGVYLTIALALAFDYSNGFHDAANSIATVVSTRVLAPRYAVAWAAFFNFIAFLVFKTHVANTIAKDVVLQDVLSIGVVFSGLIGAIVWNLITFYLGLPSSSSHALVGGSPARPSPCPVGTCSSSKACRRSVCSSCCRRWWVSRSGWSSPT